MICEDNENMLFILHREKIFYSFLVRVVNGIFFLLISKDINYCFLFERNRLIGCFIIENLYGKVFSDYKTNFNFKG